MAIEKLVLTGVNNGVLKLIRLKPKGKQLGVVHIIHGMAEHKERYLGFMKYLSNQGFTVYAHDHRGHGESLLEGQVVGIFTKDDHFANIIKDVDLVQQYILKEEQTDEIIPLGHSMGSLILRRYLQTKPTHIKKAIIMGTLPKYNKAFSITMIGLAYLTGLFMPNTAKHHFLAKLMNDGLAKKVENKESKFDWLSVNKGNVKNYIEDDLCGYTYNKRFYQSFFKLILKTNLKQNIQKTPNIDLLFIAGALDPLSKNMRAINKLARYYEKVTDNQQITVKPIYGARHEILNENNKDYVYDYIKNYLMLQK